MTDVAKFITINRDFIKNRFEDKTTVNMETSATQDKETAQRRKEILMTKKTDVIGCLITFWPLTGLSLDAPGAPWSWTFVAVRGLENLSFFIQTIIMLSTRFYRVRTLSCLQFSLEHSLDLLTSSLSSSSSSHSSLLMVNRTKNVKINGYTPHPSVKDKQHIHIMSAFSLY